jgi:acyl-CoA thioesterase FadM
VSNALATGDFRNGRLTRRFLVLKALRIFNPALWGVSIALSWTWGLGLFFSVQMGIQFGLAGLLAFAIPNAVGLAAFGWFAEHIARKQGSGEEFEAHFLRSVGHLRWVFLLYQVIAISLTFFALFKYVFLPLGVNLPMVALLVMGAGLLLGEQLTIDKIKWSHLAMGCVIALSILLIGWGGASYFAMNDTIPRPDVQGVESVISWNFLGFFVPILVGFLLGPWLDIQQWQRAIQIRKESTNVRTAYTLGGLLFFGILMFHGTLALAIWGEATRLGLDLQQVTADGIFHAKDAVVRFLFESGVTTPLLFRVMYPIFLCLCIISTIDSGYVSLKWFQADALKKSDSLLINLIPPSFLNSPIPPFTVAAVIALLAVPLSFELEYFMAFYGSFLVGYAMVFLFRTTFQPQFTSFTQTTLVSLAGFSLGIFGIGYFERLPLLMVAAALTPLIHAIVCIATRKAVHEIKRSGVMDRLAEGNMKGALDSLRPGEKKTEGSPGAVPAPRHVETTVDPSPNVSLVSGQGSSWIEDKTFIHSFTATYQDTNSVGNVYFAQYAMWVGKTRELFFHHAMPTFDLATTKWFVLTRSFEHKFLKETREFEQIQVRLWISGVNRKFVTLEHQVFDSSRQMLGKGKQVLLFVSSADYNIIDVPQDCMTAFLPYLGGTDRTFAAEKIGDEAPARTS